MRTKHALGFWVFVLVVCSLEQRADNQYPSFLWEIRNEYDQPEGYLFGTMHSTNSGVYGQLAKIDSYLNQCNVFAGEVDFNELSSVSAFNEVNFFMEDTSLAMLYDSVNFNKISVFLKEQLGPQAALVQTMKPFWISATLTMQSETGTMDGVLDVALQEKALELGMTLMPLETVASQAKAIDEIPLETQARMLLEMVSDFDHQEALMKILPELYASQDLQTLYELYEKETLPGAMHQALVIKRNKGMTDSLVNLLQTQELVFCGVGALHLPGKQGMINLLRARGYTLHPIALDE